MKETLAAYKRAGCERYFIQRHPQAQPPEMVDWLLAAGLEKARGGQKFKRGREAPPQGDNKPTSDLGVEEIGPDQGMAFARILCDALDLGCREMYTCTGEAVPGDPQHSFKNIAKAGFTETYVRDNYAPPKAS